MQANGPTNAGYYVKLPQSEQQVRYVADHSGYHGSLAVPTNRHRSAPSNYALGQQAFELDNETHQSNVNKIPYESQETSATSDVRAIQNPLEFYILQTQYPMAQHQTSIFQLVPDELQNIVQYSPMPNIYFGEPKGEYYNYQVHHVNTIPSAEQNNNFVNKNNLADSGETLHDKTTETRPIEVIQVFKNHSCSKKEEEQVEIDNNKDSLDISDFPNIEPTVNGNFGAKEPKLYKGTVNFRVESPRSNARNERLFYSSVSGSTTPQTVMFNEEEGISRLVASTQDLISNEDLLKINHAEEVPVYNQNDDLIKPRAKYSVRSQQFHESSKIVPQSHVSFSTKYGNLVNTKTKHTENHRQHKKKPDEYSFKRPIIVADSEKENYKQKAVNNLISTMVPYIQDGYELVGLKNSLDETEQHSDEDLVNITPRPVGQNFLTPITVALRLLDANDTDFEDHEISESENIPEKAMPDNERTIIEIQQSIPIEITHINDVEYHREYMEDGRSNNRPFNYGKALYNQYDSKLYGRHTHNDDVEYNQGQRNVNSRDNEQSGNTYNEVHVHPNEDENSKHVHETQDHKHIVQPIIIEKEVPVTKFVDRFIEKQVPYPEPVEIVKQVPVDRPVPVPVRYETIVEKPVEVTRYVDKPYPVEVRVPYPVEHKIYVDRPVHVPYAVEKIVEKNILHPVAVPTPVAVPVPVEQKVLYPVPVEKPVPVPVPVDRPVDRIVHKEVPVPYPVEKKVPYLVPHEVRVPVPYPVERRIPVPVEKIVEKPVTKIVERHIKVPHPVPYEVHVPKPYPVDRIVEKKVPYPVHIDRIIEKKVPVQVPYPVKTVVEKIVEKPVIVTKYVDKPYPVERIVEKKVPYPVEVKSHYSNKPDIPYQFEKIDPAIYYGYGNGGYQHGGNFINYIPRVSTLQQNQQLQNYMQHQAESQRIYQIQKATDEYLKGLYKQNVPVHSSLWGTQYASSYSYLNATDKNYVPSNYITNDQKYYGPPPTKAYNFTWEKHQDYDRRRTDRVPKNLRIEYGGFKPPLIPSTEVDLDGNPIKKQ
ncbi:unnamed protein product [Leptosia nina]|uniref:Uncharacterized protein n=1 Tax=Leptosia nina TaxID=320188 RepID=A0AAV1JKE0_9NEOP